MPHRTAAPRSFSAAARSPNPSRCSAIKLDQYETLFEDKLDLFAALASEPEVTWSGTTRPPLTNQRVYPPIETGTLKTWIGVGGSPESVVRAVRYDMPLMLAIIGGEPERFKPYRRSLSSRL